MTREEIVAKIDRMAANQLRVALLSILLGATTEQGVFLGLSHPKEEEKKEVK